MLVLEEKKTEILHSGKKMESQKQFSVFEVECRFKCNVLVDKIKYIDT